MFYNDYELTNPFTIKKGRINYLERLKNLNYFSQDEFLAKKQRIEKTLIWTEQKYYIISGMYYWEQ